MADEKPNTPAPEPQKPAPPSNQSITKGDSGTSRPKPPANQNITEGKKR